MSVYLDRSRNSYGRMVMCHMIADTPQELRLMAVAIGMNLKWFQKSASSPHFDICLSKAAEARARGAITLERRAFVEQLRWIKITWPQTPEGGWSL